MRIKFLIHNGKEALHRYLVEVIIKIADYIFSDSEKTKKGVDRAMGGEVLELKTDKLINEIRQDVKEEKEKAVVVNDALTTERLAYWKQRRYLSLPIDSMVITSHYGKRKDPFTGKIANHRGIDLKGNNDYVYSIMPGMVVKTGKNKGLGNYVEVRHGDFTSIYGHLYSVLVNAKQAVEAGQPIGISGSTGRSTGEHLHFQMEYKDKTIDPKPILDYINEVIRTVKGQISQQIDNELRRK